MKLVNSVLYLEIDDLIESGFKAKKFINAKNHGTRYMRFLDDPADARKVLVEYSCLKDADKEAVTARFGDPYTYVAQQPIRQMIKKDWKADAFYLNYRFENGMALPLEHVYKYDKCAAVLNMLVAAEKEKQLIKSALCVTISAFYDKVIEIIIADQIDLPTSYRNLLPKIKAYKSGGYESLIEKWRFNNTYAQKINDDLSQAMLLELIADDSKHDDVIVAKIYNRWAAEKNYRQITDATVGIWRRENEAIILGYRSGNKVWYNKYGKQLLRTRPSAPLLMIGGDGNDWDMYFKGEKASKGTVQMYYFNQFVLVIVIDTFNDYILGWSISEVNGSENAELIKAAYVDALQHIKELTGDYYLPHQLQSDRFAHKELLPFFQKIDDQFFFAAARAPRGKYIERSFGTRWHQILRAYKNYSGNNVTAQTKLNPDRIDRERALFPDISEGFSYAHNFIEQLRQLPSETTGLSKQQEWLSAFDQNEKSREKRISKEQFLYKFGTYNTRQQTSTNRGLEVQISNVEHQYEIPDRYYMDTVGKTVSIIFDPYDFSQVMVTDGHKLRFMAAKPYLLPAAKADATDKDEAIFFSRLNAKKMHMARIAEKKSKREKVLLENGVSARAELQAGTLDKLIKRDALLQYNDVLYNSKGSGIDPLEQM